MARKDADTIDRMPAREAQERLGVSKNTLYAALKAGDIPCLKVGGQYIIVRSRFEDWIAGKVAA